MIFVTTFTEDIYNICGRELLKSFEQTENNLDHQLIVFFEDQKNPHTEYYPEWLVEWANRPHLTFVNVMTCKYKGTNIVDCIDIFLAPRIKHTDEYASPRSVKWFRPVASMYFAALMVEDQNFCSIDADCIFTSKVVDDYINSMVSDYNIAYLGRDHFKVMRHGGYASDGSYIQTGEAEATDKDTHSETGFIVYNMQQPETLTFIEKNLLYWVDHTILQLKYQTDCHTFDAVRKSLPLRYNNLCLELGEVSPIGSRVVEAAACGKFLMHSKGTIGPTLYKAGKL